MTKKKRLCCICPYCDYVSTFYETLKLHLTVYHPNENQIVKEKYVEVDDEDQFASTD